MKKIFLFLLPIFLAFVVFGIIVYFATKKNTEKGALQVTSNPQANVFLNGKLIGKTPICKCDQQDMIPTGDYDIRLVPVGQNTQSYEDKVTIYPSVLSVVDRTFGDTGKSSGSIITLTALNNKKTSQLFISSVPVESDILLDNNPSGKTPTLLQNITDSDHNITLSKLGYATKTFRIHTVLGYKLNITAYLPTDLSAQGGSTSSGSFTIPTPTPTASIPQVVILDTPTGFLRVRTEPSLAGSESARVIPGQILTLIKEQEGWYQIQLENGTTGWISASYAKKQ